MTHNKLIVQVKAGEPSTGKLSPEIGSNFERIHRRQKANNSLLIPSERLAKMPSFNQTSAHRVSLRSIANSGDFTVELNDALVPPRVGRSLVTNVKHSKGPRANRLISEENQREISNFLGSDLDNGRLLHNETPRQSAGGPDQGYFSLNNSLGMNDFAAQNLLTSPQQDPAHNLKLQSITSPQTEKQKFLRSAVGHEQLHPPHHSQKQSLQTLSNQAIALNNSMPAGSDNRNQQQSHRTDDQNVSRFLLNNSSASANPSSINSSFRVENRRARPKIVQNVVDQGNAFFIKQANILNTSHKRHRRGVSSPDTEVLFLNKIERHNALRMQQAQSESHNAHAYLHGAGLAAPCAQQNSDQTQERDQFNFTFFKDKSE